MSNYLSRDEMKEKILNLLNDTPCEFTATGVRSCLSKESKQFSGVRLKDLLEEMVKEGSVIRRRARLPNLSFYSTEKSRVKRAATQLSIGAEREEV